MTVKQKYKIGDPAWIYGISRTNNKMFQGKIIHSFTLEHAGWNDEVHYVIAIPNEIEPLLEVRTWHNISQDSRGPVGCFRQAVSPENIESVDKKLSQLGLIAEDYSTDQSKDDEDEDDIDPDIIHAAMERASKSSTLPPLNLKEPKPKRKFNNRRKKNNAV